MCIGLTKGSKIHWLECICVCVIGDKYWSTRSEVAIIAYISKPQSKGN